MDRPHAFSGDHPPANGGGRQEESNPAAAEGLTEEARGLFLDAVGGGMRLWRRLSGRACPTNTIHEQRGGGRK